MSQPGLVEDRPDDLSVGAVAEDGALAVLGQPDGGVLQLERQEVAGPAGLGHLPHHQALEDGDGPPARRVRQPDLQALPRRQQGRIAHGEPPLVRRPAGQDQRGLGDPVDFLPDEDRQDFQRIRDVRPFAQQDGRLRDDHGIDPCRAIGSMLESSPRSPPSIMGMLWLCGLILPRTLSSSCWMPVGVSAPFQSTPAVVLGSTG